MNKGIRGRRLASPQAAAETSTTPNQGELIPTPSLESLNFRQLKSVAQLLKIPGYSGLRQADMLEAVKERSGDIYPALITQAIAIADGWKTRSDNRKN